MMNRCTNLTMSLLLLLALLLVAGCGSEELPFLGKGNKSGSAYEVVDDYEKGEDFGKTSPLPQPPIGNKGPVDPALIPENDSNHFRGKALDVYWYETWKSYNTTIQDLSTIHQLNFPTVPCCRDFGESSKHPGMDNAFEKLNQYYYTPPSLSYNSIRGNSPMGALMEQVHQVDSAYFIDQRDFVGGAPSGKGRSLLSILRGETVSKETPHAFYDQNLTYWSFKKDSFEQDRDEGGDEVWRPRFYVNSAIYDRMLTRIRFEFETLDFPVLVGPIVLDLPIRHARFEAEVNRTQWDDVDRSYTYFSEGKMSGYVKVDDLFEAVNQYVRKHCSCGETSEALFVKNRSGYWDEQCNLEVYRSCPPNPQNKFCYALMHEDESFGGDFLCENFPNTVQNLVADVESASVGNIVSSGVSGGGKAKVWDALSIGYIWGAKPVMVGHPQH